jgi:hypothetical protein
MQINVNKLTCAVCTVPKYRFKLEYLFLQILKLSFSLLWHNITIFSVASTYKEHYHQFEISEIVVVREFFCFVIQVLFIHSLLFLLLSYPANRLFLSENTHSNNI